MPCYLEDINFKISSKNRTICSRRAYTFFRSSAIGSTETAYKTGVNPKLSDIRGKFTFNTWSIEYNENDRIWPTLVLTHPRSSGWSVSLANKKRQTTWASSGLWHRRLGHIGHAALLQLHSKADTESQGVRFRGPYDFTRPDSCICLVKISRRILRLPDSRPDQINKTLSRFHHIQIDRRPWWFEQGYDGY